MVSLLTQMSHPVTSGRRRRPNRENRSAPRFSRRISTSWSLAMIAILVTLPSLSQAAAADGCDWIGRLVVAFISEISHSTDSIPAKRSHDLIVSRQTSESLLATAC